VYLCMCVDCLLRIVTPPSDIEEKQLYREKQSSYANSHNNPNSHHPSGCSYSPYHLTACTQPSSPHCLHTVLITSLLAHNPSPHCLHTALVTSLIAQACSGRKHTTLNPNHLNTCSTRKMAASYGSPYPWITVIYCCLTCIQYNLSQMYTKNHL
jgi:hypothetical protein